MDVELLSGMIGELMLDYDSLNLPGLGTFVAEEIPASFSDKGYTVNPPYRRLSFSENVSPDTLLIDFYAGANPQAPKEAEALLVDFLRQLADELRQRKAVELPGLGRLRATRENHFFFVPDEALDISPDACGLGSVSLKTHSVALPELKELNAPVVKEVEEVPVAAESAAPGPETAVPETAVSEPAEPVKVDVPEPESSRKATPAARRKTTPAEPKPRRKAAPAVRWAIGIAAAAAVLLGGFVALSRIAPDVTDKLLYTQEELEILNYPEDGLGLPG